MVLKFGLSADTGVELDGKSSFGSLLSVMIVTISSCSRFDARWYALFSAANSFIRAR